MKKKISFIIIKLFVLLIPYICISLIISLNPIQFLDGEYSMYSQNKEYSNSHNHYCRVLIIGDSVGKAAWIPNLLSEDTYNFSLGGICSIEDYYLLREYLKNNQTPQYVILTQGVNHFISLDTFWNRSVYFHRISLFDMLDVYKEEKKIGQNIVFQDKDLIDLFAYYSYSPFIYNTAFFNGLKESRKTTNEEIHHIVSNNKGYWEFGKADGYYQPNYYVSYDSFDYKEIFDLYFKRLIELCEKNNIKFIYQIVPVNQSTFNQLKPTFLKEYNSYMNNIQKLYPNTIINSDFLGFDDSLFGDATHLNRKGAEKFSKEMKLKYKDIFEGE